jgi:hypothetical protein
MRRSLLLLALATSTTAAAASARSETLHVPGDYATIQAAVDVAQAGDTVLVADGIWTGTGNRDIDPYGASIVIRSENGPEHCVIDCQGSYSDPHRAFVIESGESRATVIDGFTIRRGSTLPGAVSDPFNGGGIRILQSSPTIRSCIFEDNVSGCWGGGLFAGNGGSPLVTGCLFRGNYSADDGGGAFNWNGAYLEITDSVFVDNTADVTGGAITAFDNIKIRNVTLVGNSASYGRAIYAVSGEISNSVVWGNGAGPILGSATVRYSLVEGGSPGTGNIDLPPRFAPDGIHLRVGSPAIDAADPAYVPPADERDIDGEPRKFMIRVDMGADEFRRDPLRFH